MNWIGTQVGSLLNPEQEAELARSLAELQALLGATPLADGTNDAISLLDKLAQGLHVPVDTLPPALVARLAAWFDKARTTNPDIQRLRALLSPLSAMNSPAGSQVKSINWPLNAQADGSADAIQLKLPLSLSGNASAGLVACAALPQNAGQPPAGSLPLQISLAGNVAVTASATLPVNYFTLSASAASQDSLAFDFYSLHPGETLLVAAVAAALERLSTSPFDLGDVATRLRNREWQCVVATGKGTVSLSGRIALASPFSLAGGKLNLADLAYGYSATLDGQFSYQLRADGDQPGKVVLQLSRNKGNSQTQDAAAKVGVDLDSALARIQAEALPCLQKASAILGQADTLLQPGAAIRQQLQDSLGKLDEGTASLLTPLLEGLLGFKSGRGALDALHEVLTQEITTRSLDVDKQVNLSAGQLLDLVLARLGVPDGRRQDLHGKLDAGIAGALDRIRGQADQKLTQIAEKNGAPAVADALQQSGIQVQGALAAAGQAVAGVRALVLRYRQLAAQLCANLGSSTALKLNASLSHTQTDTASATLDLVLRFDPTIAAAGTAFRLAMLGAFDGALELGRSGGQGVEVLDCRLRRVLASTRDTGLEVAVLGLSVSGGTLLGQDTAVDLDGAGNITVLSTADMAKRRGLNGETRSLRVADVFALAAAKATRSLKLDITLSQEDSNLDVNEAVSFFQSLTDAGLLSAGRAAQAGQYLQDNSTTAPGSNHAGRLDVNLDLAGGDLDTLMGVGQADPDFASRVRQVAADEMAQAYVRSTRLTEKNILDLLNEHYEIEATLSATIQAFDDRTFVDGKPGEGLPLGSPAWNHALAVNRMHQLCDELVLALSAMRSLYQISDQDLAALKDPATYQKRQDEIMLYAKDGVPTDFPGLFGHEAVNAATVALFRILAILAGKSPGQGDVLSATMMLTVGDTQQLRLIA